VLLNFKKKKDNVLLNKFKCPPIYLLWDRLWWFHMGCL